MKRQIKLLAISIWGIGLVSTLTTNSVFAETQYEYDDLDRVTKDERDDGTVVYYKYDGNGNLTSVVVEENNNMEYNPGNETGEAEGQNADIGEENLSTDKRTDIGENVDELGKPNAGLDTAKAKEGDEADNDIVIGMNESREKEEKEEKQVWYIWFILTIFILLFLSLILTWYRKKKQPEE